MDLRTVASAVEHYEAEASEASVARLEFFKGVMQIQQERADLVAAAGGYEAPSQEDVRTWYWAYEPFFTHTPVSLDSQAFAETCRQLALHLAAHAGLADEAAAALAEYDWEAFCKRADLALAGSRPQEFVEACLTGIDSFDVSSDLPATVFMMVPVMALRAHLQEPAKVCMDSLRLEKEDAAVHDQPLRCPVCGSPAAASHVVSTSGVTESGNRVQYCSLCGTQWGFERIRCGVCGNVNQSQLHYHHIEGDSAHRLQSCEACGQYERVVFQDDLDPHAPLVMEVEDVVMARLDQVALDPRFKNEN
ncbi:formate dehydrogenase accessory protein FdhE [Slackia heliotrinireducens]|uniref:formate dehydrogenase accessory protein FdhE n=1 Tax=Slackia heliotrinireducens TaxID=84110 RepID=UPI003315346C